MNKNWIQQWSRLMDPEPAQDGTGDVLPDPPVTPPANTPDPEVAQLKERLARFEKFIDQQPVPPQQHTPPPQDPNDQKKMLDKEYWADPVSFLQRYGNVITQNVINTMAPSLENNIKQQIRSAEPEVFDLLLPYIEQNMQGVAPQYRTQPAVWQNAFNLAKGANMDKVLELRGRKTNVNNDGPALPNTRQAPAPKKEQLSEDENSFIKAFKLTPDQYRRGKEFVADQEKMWEQVITFDSDTSRRSVDGRK